MNVRSVLLACQLVLALMTVPGIARAAQSYDNCTGFITTLPAVISTQGTWCLKQDLTTAISSGVAITINTNNVTVDCNDFKLGGLAAGVGTSTFGIYANDRLNATVRNCSIRGFLAGVRLIGTNGGGHLLEDNRFDGNTQIGIYLEGDGSVIRRNRILDTGGTTLTLEFLGIDTGSGVIDIKENIVSGVIATGGSGGIVYGIRTNFNGKGTIEGNSIRDLAPDGASSGYGIYNLNSGVLVLRGNNVFGNGTGIGLRCFTTDSSARDNEIANFNTGLGNCADVSGNHIH
jgi:parallel beta-helix repeat protein